MISDAFISGYVQRIDFPELDEAGIDKEKFYNKAHIDLYSLVFDDEKTNYHLARLSMTPTMKKILDYLETRKKYDKESKGYVAGKAPKMVLYSGHDTNTVGLVLYIKAAFPELIKKFPMSPFASSILIPESSRKTLEKKFQSAQRFLNDDFVFLAVKSVFAIKLY